MFQVRFGNTDTYIGFIPVENAQQNIYIEWNGDSNKLYTVLMVDLDYPYPSPGNNISPYLHLLISNIKGSDIVSGNSFIEYLPPNPPKDSKPHTYFIGLYLQSNRLRNRQYKNRKNFDIDKFITTNNLFLLESNYFQSGYYVPTAVSSKLSFNTNSFNTNKNDMFISNSELPENKKKFCRCVLKVANKQRGLCNTDRAWFETRNGQQCYNPYSICAKSVGTTSRECGKNYNFSTFSDEYLITYSELHQKDKNNTLIIPEPYDRNQMLTNIYTWKQSKSK